MIDYKKFQKEHGGQIVNGGLGWEHQRNRFNAVGYCAALGLTVNEYIDGLKPAGKAAPTKAAPTDGKRIEGTLRGNKIIFNNLEIGSTKNLKTASAERQYKEVHYSFTDSGNAQRLFDRFGDVVDYIHELGKFAIFDGTVHTVDESGKVIHSLYKQIGEEMVKEAYSIEDRELRESALKWCRQSEFYKIYASTLAHLGKMTAHHLNEYDADDHKINCLNGVLNLKTFSLEPHTPEQKHLKVIRANYKPEAQAPRWQKFIEEITSKDGANRPDLAHYLHKVLGYSLLADTSEKCIFFFYGGTGDNGKSTLILIVEYLLGPYAQRISSGSLMKRFQASDMRNDLAKLIGARFVAGSEVGKNQQFDDGLIRDLVGGDAITCRFLRQEFFTYIPVYKLFLYGNNKPRIDADDPAIRKKIKMIPFDFQPTTADKNLKKTLKAEADGIFAWMVDGLRKYYTEGLEEPEEISGMTKEYFDDNDFISRFLSEYYITVPGDDAAFIPKSELYEKYKTWSEGEGYKKPLSLIALARRIKDKNIKENIQKIDGKPVRVWCGLKEINDAGRGKDDLYIEFE